ncbi:hypothetical protein N836_10000 [Leptolyngbya sp. Heron Island J]|uniref:hypothetical protein n=1 Tax=Leptolyngbya sp. Heron Island J TaxID=1385935 RepID=UPI0003B94C76|nr:hypothetical protein [Leptolyngbya sp. Heron Island J]ESA35851.1 hypothetical protein N836_10000 [Leptolyngbya sp. Heron Island J]
MTTPLRLDDSQREDNDAAVYKLLTRDVCFLFHELAVYRHIIGDLDYANDYAIPYWILINRIETGRDDDRLIRSGILILFLAMLQDEFDGSGCWISNHLDAVSAALHQFVPEDNEMLQLSDSVLHGIELLRANIKSDDRFDGDLAWAYNTFVRRYFEDSTA